MVYSKDTHTAGQSVCSDINITCSIAHGDTQLGSGKAIMIPLADTAGFHAEHFMYVQVQVAAYTLR